VTREESVNSAYQRVTDATSLDTYILLSAHFVIVDHASSVLSLSSRFSLSVRLGALEMGSRLSSVTFHSVRPDQGRALLSGFHQATKADLRGGHARQKPKCCLGALVARSLMISALAPKVL